MAGVSLKPAFGGKALDRGAPLFFEHKGSRAIRDGRWKLVRNPGGKWELYDLENDRSELNDLAGTKPERVQQMTKAWTDWAKRSNVLKSKKK
jgi:arylsulfatase